MRKAKTAKRAKKEFQLSEAAQSLIAKLHELVIKEVTKMDKKSQKSIKQ